jgi:urease accessory protein
MVLATVIQPPSNAAPEPVRPQRARGRARLSVSRSDGATRLDTMFQEGSAKLRLPRNRAGVIEAVMINSAGGLTGGDRFDWTVEVGPAAAAVLTTQACEKVYRAEGGPARVTAHLTVGAGGRLDWLPQETILFDRSALHRRIEADVAPGGALLLAEAVILGRQAMGETVLATDFHDRWRIRREGRLVFAEDLRLAGDIATLTAGRSLLAGARAFATLLLLDDAPEALLPAVRAAIGPHGGASAFEGKLVVRLAAADGLTLRRALLPAIAALRTGQSAPGIWTL